MVPFHSSKTVKLTSTTSSQTVAVPAGFDDIVIYNGGNYPVYLKYGTSVAVPVVGTWTDKLICVQPGTTQTFNNRDGGGTLAYIAETTGGTLILSVGDGF